MIIPISGATPPDSAAALQSQIESGAVSVGLTARSVQVEAPVFPEITNLCVDLSGSSVSDFADLPKLQGKGEGWLQAQQFALRAQPLSVKGLPLDLQIQAQQAQLQLFHLSGNRSAYALQQAQNGTMALATAIPELERFGRQLLSDLAKPHGADIVEAHLKFTPRGAKGLSFQADVVAKVMIMKAPLSVAGDLDLSDDLQLRISNLKLTGSGMAASLARNFLQPQFDKIQQQPISLSALALGDLRLRDVSLAVEGDTLRLSGSFAS